MAVVDFEEAMAIVQREGGTTAQAGFARIPLLDSAGRVLAEPVRADRDQPPFDRSTRDGFAIRATLPSQELRVVGEIRAGEAWHGAELADGEAIAIMTGAPLPPGADAVIMIEHVERAGDTIRIAAGRRFMRGENVVVRGMEARAGAEVLSAGVRIGPSEIALAATCGAAMLPVFARPQVAIVATGDELVGLEETPGPQQIRNSNSYALAALTSEAGGAPEQLPVAPDTRGAIADRVEHARASELIVFSGGVSMGEYDLVEQVLASLGADFFFTGVRMQPGKPVVFGRLPAQGMAPARYFFGLPGNPISTEVTFRCFVAPLVRALGGEVEHRPKWSQATLAESIAAKAGLTRLLPARTEGTALRLVAWQGSGDLAANARANCYAELLPGHGYAEGDVIRVLLR